MLDLRFVVENLDAVRKGLQRRGGADEALLSSIAEKSDERRKIIVDVEALRAQRNEVSANMAKADKKSEEFATQREAMRQVGESVKALEERQRVVDADLEAILFGIPNLPHETTPDGTSEADNKVVRVWGEKPTYAFAPKEHAELGVALGILDFERGTKISGARFTVQRDGAARLTRALMSFMLDVHTRQSGYSEIWPPALVKDSAMRGTGQLPKFAKDSFRIAKDWDEQGVTEGYDLFLTPTAEVPVTNLHADEILDGATLPVAYTAYTPCFRSEAGSYGKDTRGLIRQHQFDKVELVRFSKPEDGEAELEKLTHHAEMILQQLGLHYRVMALCCGDMGANSQKTYDLEVWLPGQNAFREISSCSWFGDFQARRAKIRFRRAQGAKPEFVHTLNGSGLAIGRTMVAILEQGQREDGSVAIPEALWPYMHDERELKPRAVSK